MNASLWMECGRAAARNLLTHGFRSFLTILGIVIAVAAVIVVIALVQGLSESVTEQFQGLGGNVLTIRSETTFEEALQGRVNRLTQSDYAVVKDRTPGLAQLTPIVALNNTSSQEVRSGKRSAFAKVFGTTETYEIVQNTYVARGRFLTKIDDAGRRRVCVIGEKSRKDLDLPEDPTGRYILLRGEWFKIVGVMEPKGEFFGVSQDDYVIIPYATAIGIQGNEIKPDVWIFAAVASDADIDAVKERMIRTLRSNRAIKPGQKNDFKIESAEQVAKSFGNLAASVTAVLGSVVGVSLLVGGIGIMNVMLISVTERTQEIGIAKALGATRRFILFQFLSEAAILALIGGVVGLGAGYAIAAGAAAMIPGVAKAAIPWWAVFGTFLFCSCLGLVFGVVPAAKAASLQPIQALRHE